MCSRDVLHPTISDFGICVKGGYICPMSMRNSLTREARLQALLRKVRNHAGIRQADLADKLGQPQSFVSKYESGERRLDILELRDVCQALGMPLQEFIQRLEEELQ
jgi:ribosome-binding protein aMBF1 (putative translation factor)